MTPTADRVIYPELPDPLTPGDLQQLFSPSTSESYRTMGRVSHLMASGKMFEDLKLPALDPSVDRVMICGSPGMLKDLKDLKDLKVMLEVHGFKEGTTSKSRDFVIERAFAEK
jgi:ferredoxin--NADP+ reductase